MALHVRTVVFLFFFFCVFEIVYLFEPLGTQRLTTLLVSVFFFVFFLSFWPHRIWMWVASTTCMKSKLKIRAGRLEFSDPDGIGVWKDKKGEVVRLPPWDLDVERKRRLWKPFWNRIMENDTELSGKEHDHGPLGNASQVHPEMSAEEMKRATKKKKKMRRLSMEVAPDGSGLKIPYPIQRWDETLEVLRLRACGCFFFLVCSSVTLGLLVSSFCSFFFGFRWFFFFFWGDACRWI